MYESYDAIAALLETVRSGELGYLYREPDVVAIGVDTSGQRPIVVVTADSKGAADRLRKTLPKRIAVAEDEAEITVIVGERLFPTFDAGRPAVGAGLSGYGTAGWNIALMGASGLHVVTISNWHVLCARGNDTALNTPVFLDGMRLARLYAFEPLQPSGNIWDFALAEFLSPTDANGAFRRCDDDSLRPYPQRLTPASDVKVGDTYFKVGARAPTCRTGKLLGVNDVRIDYPDASRWFSAQLVFSKMSDPGDSGSIIVHAASTTVTGLNFAGNDNITIANPIFKIGWNSMGRVQFGEENVTIPIFDISSSSVTIGMTFAGPSLTQQAFSMPESLQRSIVQTAPVDFQVGVAPESLPVLGITPRQFLGVAIAEVGFEKGGTTWFDQPKWRVPPPPAQRQDSSGQLITVVQVLMRVYHGFPEVFPNTNVDYVIVHEFLCFG